MSIQQSNLSVEKTLKKEAGSWNHTYFFLKLQRESNPETLDSPVSSTGQAKPNPERQIKEKDFRITTIGISNIPT